MSKCGTIISYNDAIISYNDSDAIVSVSIRTVYLRTRTAPSDNAFQQIKGV